MVKTVPVGLDTPKPDSILLIPFNTLNSSHASFSLFHLPTLHKTYHLTSTTKDLRSNLGFKTSSFALVEEHLKRITNNTLLASLNHKMDLDLWKHLTLIS